MRTRKETFPARIAERPDPSDWNGSELLTLQEAAALFWPGGAPLGVSSLRTAVRDRKLAVTWVAGKVFTTPSAIARMSECAVQELEPSPPETDAPPPRTVAELKRRLTMGDRNRS